MSKLIPAEEVHKKDMQDPEYRAEWERTALAREVSELLVGYRVKHDISQTELAKRLGTGQAKVSRLEAGEHTPNLQTLKKIATVLEIDLTIVLHPGKGSSGNEEVLLAA